MRVLVMPAVSLVPTSPEAADSWGDVHAAWRTRDYGLHLQWKRERVVPKSVAELEWHGRDWQWRKG